MAAPKFVKISPEEFQQLFQSQQEYIGDIQKLNYKDEVINKSQNDDTYILENHILNHFLFKFFRGV